MASAGLRKNHKSSSEDEYYGKSHNLHDRFLTENVLFCSEQFQVEPGTESTSLISNLPGIAGTGTGGGIGDAHP
jgi:hypothetical protein